MMMRRRIFYPNNKNTISGIVTPDSRVVRKTMPEAVTALLSCSIAKIATREAVGIADKTTKTPSMVSFEIKFLKTSHTTTGNKISFTKASG